MIQIRRHLNTLMLVGIALSIIGAAVSHFLFGDAQPFAWIIPLLFTFVVGIASWLYNRDAEREGVILRTEIRESREENEILSRHIVLGASGNPYVSAAEEYLRRGDEDTASRNYERALRANGNDMNALLGMGSLAFLRCIIERTLGHAERYQIHLDQALALLEHAYYLESHNRFVLEGLACALDEKEGSSSRAQSLLEELTRLHPDHRSAHANLGVAYLRVGKIEDAKREFLYQIEYANEFLGIYHLGDYYKATGQLCHASICYEYTLVAARRYMLGSQAGSDSFALHNLAVWDYIWCLMRLGIIGAALNAINEAVAIWTQYGQPIPKWVPRQRRGLKVLRRLYRFAHLRFVIKRALHRPTHQGRVNLLLTEDRLKPLLDNGHYYEAMQVCRHAIFLEPQAALAHANHAALLFGYGNVEQARAQATLARTLARRNKDSAAMEAAQAVLDRPETEAGEITWVNEDTLIQQTAMAAQAIRNGEDPPEESRNTETTYADPDTTHL